MGGEKSLAELLPLATSLAIRMSVTGDLGKSSPAPGITHLLGPSIASPKNHPSTLKHF